MTKRLSRGGKGERLEKQDVADERENFACDNYKYEYKYESEKDVRVRHGFGNLKINNAARSSTRSILSRFIDRNDDYVLCITPSANIVYSITSFLPPVINCTL